MKNNCIKILIGVFLFLLCSCIDKKQYLRKSNRINERIELLQLAIDCDDFKEFWIQKSHPVFFINELFIDHFTKKLKYKGKKIKKTTSEEESPKIIVVGDFTLLETKARLQLVSSDGKRMLNISFINNELKWKIKNSLLMVE